MNNLICDEALYRQYLDGDDNGLDALMKMETERTPLYRAASDAAVDNTGRLEDTVAAAVDAFERTFDYR